MTDAEPTWDGREDCECGEHVTTNDRTWCLEDKEWCYPDAPCRGCELPVLRAEVEWLRGVVAAGTVTAWGVLANIDNALDCRPVGLAKLGLTAARTLTSGLITALAELEAKP